MTREGFHSFCGSWLLPPFENRGMLDQGSSAVSPEETRPEASASYPLANRYSP